jgi:hypothetical protein
MDLKAELELLRSIDVKSATVGIQQAKSLYNQAMASASKMASLAKDLPTGAIDAADFLKTIPAADKIGKLATDQVTGLMSQAAAAAKSSATAVLSGATSAIGQVSTVAAGVGKFGMSPDALEKAGLLKPGTVKQFLGNAPTPADIEKILKSPAVWTGKGGASDMASFLKAPTLQATAFQDNLKAATAKLEKLGTGLSELSSKDVGAAVQNAVKFGTDKTSAWLKGAAPADLAKSMDGVAKGAQSAVSFATKEVANLKLELPVVPQTGIVNRAAVDDAIKKIIGDAKIPTPKFGQGLLDNLPNSQLVPKNLSDLKEVAKVNEERLKRGLSAISDAKNQITGTVSNITGQINNVASQIEKQVTSAGSTIASQVNKVGSAASLNIESTLKTQAGGLIKEATVTGKSVLARLNGLGS